MNFPRRRCAWESSSRRSAMRGGAASCAMGDVVSSCRASAGGGVPVAARRELLDGQQVEGEGVRRSPGADDVHLPLRPGERHVEGVQPLDPVPVLLGVLDLPQPGVELRQVLVHAHELDARLPADDGPRVGLVPLPVQQQHDRGESQSLGLVDGHHPHRVDARRRHDVPLLAALLARRGEEGVQAVDAGALEGLHGLEQAREGGLLVGQRAEGVEGPERPAHEVVEGEVPRGDEQAREEERPRLGERELELLVQGVAAPAREQEPAHAVAVEVRVRTGDRGGEQAAAEEAREGEVVGRRVEEREQREELGHRGPRPARRGCWRTARRCRPPARCAAAATTVSLVAASTVMSFQRYPRSCSSRTVSRMRSSSGVSARPASASRSRTTTSACPGSRPGSTASCRYVVSPLAAATLPQGESARSALRNTRSASASTRGRLRRLTASSGDSWRRTDGKGFPTASSCMMRQSACRNP